MGQTRAACPQGRQRSGFNTSVVPSITSASLGQAAVHAPQTIHLSRATSGPFLRDSTVSPFIAMMMFRTVYSDNIAENHGTFNAVDTEPACSAYRRDGNNEPSSLNTREGRCIMIASIIRDGFTPFEWTIPGVRISFRISPSISPSGSE